ncbi:MAG: M14 family metallopeptidase [Bacteroidales bacterium]|nr:M14 family metallopeptidase [Bacteroidales bacterium]
MEREIIFRMNSPFREEFRIQGFRFGKGKKTIAIVGSIRGDEVQQQFICSQIVKNLMEIEEKGGILPDHEILVIPSVNHFSMNINKRFWAMDNTDINRMFPGYEKGETTQRIAHAVFEEIKQYKYGIQLASFYLPGEFVPHVRMMNTGYQDTDLAKLFGLPFVLVSDAKPYDTAILNYNWQVFGTQAFSVYSGTTDSVHKASAKVAWLAVLRFLHKMKIIHNPIHEGYNSAIITDSNQVTVKSDRGGILYTFKGANDEVKEGDMLAKVLDPFTGETLSTIISPAKGMIFFAYEKPLISENTVLYKIVVY